MINISSDIKLDKNVVDFDKIYSLSSIYKNIIDPLRAFIKKKIVVDGYGDNFIRVSIENINTDVAVSIIKHYYPFYDKIEISGDKIAIYNSSNKPSLRNIWKLQGETWVSFDESIEIITDVIKTLRSLK